MPDLGESRATSTAQFAFTCPLAAGLHARPASLLAEVADRYGCECTLTNLRTGASANLKSTLSIIAADVRQGDGCRVQCSGPDAEREVLELRRFIDDKLPSVDDIAGPATASAIPVALPRALRGRNFSYVAGTAASEGIGIGVVVHLTRTDPVQPSKSLGAAVERQHLGEAISRVRAKIVSLRARASSREATGILNAHLALLNDVALVSRFDELMDSGSSAAAAVQQAAAEFRNLLAQSASAYVRERALDVQDVAARILEHLAGASASPVELSEPSVVVAETITPQELLRLDRKFVAALVIEYAGVTSHTMILARSLAIPALAGVRGAEVEYPEGTRVVVDALRGVVIKLDGGDIDRFYRREIETQRNRRSASLEIATAPARTIDGRALEVAANVSSALEVEAAFRSGADGIGVFRTEMLFVDRDVAPAEEEQFEIYREAARTAGGRPVIIRTADIGGDKSVPHLQLPLEENPFLGYRGARIYSEHESLFRTQVRAILRASAVGNVWIMLPMITSAAEVRWARQETDEFRQELLREGATVAERVPLGIMIEVPAAAYAIDELSEVSDFFSLGTNDLAQYFFAADRGNARVTSLSDPFQPAFLRFLKQTVDDIRRRKKWIGICGEIAGDPRMLPCWLGLGLNEISASVPKVSALKRRVARLRQAECEKLLETALACDSAEDVRTLLDGVEAEPLPLIDPALALIGSTACTREEAIHEMVSALYIAGRTDARDEIEDAVFARETTYSTALGFGFAVPHCKSDAVLADSVVVLKLARDIPWGEESVKFAILLAMRASGKDNMHMQVFSRLSRKLMDPEFRERLNAARDAESVVSILRDGIAHTHS